MVDYSWRLKVLHSRKGVMTRFKVWMLTAFIVNECGMCVLSSTIIFKKRPQTRQIETKTEHIIELLIVADCSVYEYYVNKNNSSSHDKEDVEYSMERHFRYLSYEIDRRYRMITNTNFTMRVANAGLHIIKNCTRCTWIPDSYIGQTLDASRTLNLFRIWMETAPELPPHDHAMLFTRYDLMKEESTSVAGLAYVESLCSDSSYSIVEDNESIAAITVPVHELAHSLGANHDSTHNECSNEDNYIMTATRRVNDDIETNRNNWKFSKCSVTYFKNYVAKLDREQNNCMTSGLDDNLTLPSMTDYNVVAIDTHPDDQCRNIEGHGSFLCRKFYEGNYTKICGLMYCFSVGTRNICNYRLPVDGTSCGNQMICAAGYCVKSDDAPNLSETCPFGDQPELLSVPGSVCSEILSSKAYLCYQQYYADVCCQSCKTLHTGIKGCEYGDKFARCSYTGRLECLINSDDCCSTCAYYSENTSDLVFPAAITGGVVCLLLVLVVAICIRKKDRNKVKDSAPDNQQIPDKATTHHRAGRKDKILSWTDPPQSVALQHHDVHGHLPSISQRQQTDSYYDGGQQLYHSYSETPDRILNFQKIFTPKHRTQNLQRVYKYRTTGHHVNNNEHNPCASMEMNDHYGHLPTAR